MAGDLYLIIYLLFFSAYYFAEGTIFWRNDRKKLTSVVPMETVPIKVPENCFGACLFNELCKSFNIHNGKCDIFDKDRCMVGVILADDPDSIYFDMIAENQCEPQTYSQVVINHGQLNQTNVSNWKVSYMAFLSVNY